jgi:hypothetical protein
MYPLSEIPQNMSSLGIANIDSLGIGNNIFQIMIFLNLKPACSSINKPLRIPSFTSLALQPKTLIPHAPQR